MSLSRIIELEGIRQQLQRCREVVTGHVDDVGIQRAPSDAICTRSWCAQREPVEAAADRLDQCLGVWATRWPKTTTAASRANWAKRSARSDLQRSYRPFEPSKNIVAIRGYLDASM